MKRYEAKEITVQDLAEFHCDCCGMDLLCGNTIETQEAISISYDCGYGSIFGDGNTIRVDLCQHCLNNKLGEYITVEG